MFLGIHSVMRGLLSGLVLVKMDTDVIVTLVKKMACIKQPRGEVLIANGYT